MKSTIVPDHKAQALINPLLGQKETSPVGIFSRKRAHNLYLGRPGTRAAIAVFPRLPSMGWGGESAAVVANSSRTGEALPIDSGQEVPPGIQRAGDGLDDGACMGAPTLTPEQDDTLVEALTSFLRSTPIRVLLVSSCTCSVPYKYLGRPGTRAAIAVFPRLPSMGWGGESAAVVANSSRTGEALPIDSGQEVPPGIRRAGDGLDDGACMGAPTLTPEQDDTLVE
ncbi:hypothetical protein PGTUg99_005866 [Puccinia graminis f. sp. tritici]|uniref:Uncharacterized protein n=1 Tax=Puccinia graminis f. sp. tritici TaxID=56615 RepID=A0A5B0LZQ0_PUCGR|nr:hypothetical protein PGTUg99_005866 [Puccinia graminis f. sp. tritici]